MLSSFSYIAQPDAHILILGSMPGKKSLAEQMYYAHPRNAFWPIMAELFSFNPQLEYQQRLQLLMDNKVALWDVMKHCERKTSLDSDIVESSIIANDFIDFVTHHEQITRICFNGQKARQTFDRYVKAQLPETLSYITLPSTSPANASMSFETKLSIWRSAILN